MDLRRSNQKGQFEETQRCAGGQWINISLQSQPRGSPGVSKGSGSRSRVFKCHDRELQFFSPNGPVSTRRAMTRLPLIYIRVRGLPRSIHASRFPCSHHASQVPTTKGAGRCCLRVECGHRCLESCEGSVKYHTSQGCLWLRQHHPHNDKSEYPSGFASTDHRLKRTQDVMANWADYVELGLACAGVCTALDRGLNEKRSEDLNSSVSEAITQLTT